MKDSPVFWKMRDGRLISVDDMDIKHLRNVLKMIVRNREKALQQLQSKPKIQFELNGDIAQSFINDRQDAEFEEELGYPFHDDKCRGNQW
jgi:hypothetical protein